MDHSKTHFVIIAIALAAAVPTWASARDPVVQTEQLAMRVVLVTRVGLSGRDAVVSAHGILRTAAHDVCREQYPREVYVFVRACTSGSYRDALDQLLQLRAKRQAQDSAASEQLAILVRSK